MTVKFSDGTSKRPRSKLQNCLAMTQWVVNFKLQEFLPYQLAQHVALSIETRRLIAQYNKTVYMLRNSIRRDGADTAEAIKAEQGKE